MNNNIQKYTTYKPSGVEWLGEIPEHWEVKKLKFIANIKTGYTPLTNNQNNFSEDGILWVKPDNLNEFTPIVDSKEKISTSGVKSQNVIEKGSILICCIGSIGKFGVAGTKVITNQQINSITFNRGYSSEYGKYLVFNCESEFSKWANGNVLRILNTTTQGNIYFLTPPLTEQTRIAEFLDRKTAQIDQAVTIKEKQIALLKERRQILIHRAVTRGINPDVQLKPSGVEWIGDIPEHWEVKKLRYVGKCQNGVSKGGEYFGSGFPFISYGDVYKNIELPKTANGLAQSTEADRKQYSVEEGDIFFTRTSETVEEIAFASTCKETIENATFSGFLIRFRPNKGFLYEGFSKYYFSSYTHRAFFIKEMNLVIRASLSQELLNRMPILIPPLEEQNIIAEHIENISEKIATAITLKEQEIGKLKEYKSTLINSAVTGKIKI